MSRRRSRCCACGKNTSAVSHAQKSPRGKAIEAAYINSEVAKSVWLGDVMTTTLDVVGVGDGVVVAGGVVVVVIV